MKKFIIILLIAAICFLTGVAVGRFVMSRKIVINVVDIKDLVEIIERYNKVKYELKEIKEWNEQAIVKSEEERK